jgi:type I restriction enzyme S subunit
MTEGPYKLPEGWRWVRLGEIAWRESVTLKPSDYPDLVFRYLGMEHVAPGQWDEPMPVEIPGREIKSQVIVYRPGLILYGKLRPYLNKVVVPSTEGVASTEFVPIAVNEKVVESHYLAAYLRSPAFVAYATQNTTGSRQPRVRLDALWNALIPLPPLEEQRRIVARVEELMSRIREAKRLRQEAKEEAERLWQSILSETFPKPGTELPEGWRWVKLGEVAWRDSVILRPSDNPKVVVRYLGMEHISPGQWDEPTPIELFGAEIRSQVVMYRPGLVLYGRLRPYLNKVVVPSSEGVASTEFVPIAVNKDVLSPHYLGAYLRSPWFVTYATRNTTGSRQPRVRLDALWNAPIPLPPLEEQHRIVAYLQDVQEKIRALKEVQAQTEAELKRLEQAILDKAFRGEL